MVDAEETFRRLLHGIAKEHKYDDYNLTIQPISSGGANYMSTLFVGTISAPQREDLQVFGKVANIAEAIRENAPMGEAYKQEHYFYTELIKIFEELERKHDVPEEHRLVTAKCYKSDTEERHETVLLENLLVKGYKSYDRMKSITWEYATKAVEVLAKFHALSMAYSQESPEEFKKIRSFDFAVAFGDKVGKETFSNKIFNVSFKAVRSENEAKLRKYFDGMTKLWMENKKPRSRPVVAHGDYRASNLMYRRRNGKLEIIPVDFQMLHIGCPAYDLLYLIYLGTDAKFRKLHYDNLLEHYYTELKLALQRLHVDVNDVYTRQNFQSDLNDLKMAGLVLSVSTLSLVTVNEQDTPDINLDMQIKPSDIYRERLNEIVDEYIEKGLL